MKVFFYNPSTKTSIWERPHELKNRPDVDKMLKGPAGSADEKEEETPGNKSDENDGVSHEDKKRPLETVEDSKPIVIVKKTK